SPYGIGRENFWNTQEEGKSFISEIESFSAEKFSINLGGEVKNFNPKDFLGPKGLRNLDRSTLFILTAAKCAIEDANLVIDESNTDNIGICTGTTFSHLWSIAEFDREVFEGGLAFSNPALFPSNVINSASSQVSIKFNIQGFNTTVSTGYTSSLEALKYASIALDTGKSKIVLVGGVDSLTFSLFFGFHKLQYMAGFHGEVISCPFDRRRNGPVLGEAAGVFSVEDRKVAQERGANIVAKVRSTTSFFDGFKIGRIHPQGRGLEIAVKEALEQAGVSLKDVDYISSCANSSQDVDKIEIKVLRKIFGKQLDNIPVSSIKSMLGETFSAAGSLQVISCIGAMHRGVIPPTINYEKKDPDCDIDCVPNKAQKKDVKIALITSLGQGGYNSACVLEKYTG
ncbi:MAG: beta-ketoacyl-[acyl-carrier-protein] synthase family protein, partial [Candidatus Omnitrophota bacterium]